MYRPWLCGLRPCGPAYVTPMSTIKSHVRSHRHILPEYAMNAAKMMACKQATSTPSTVIVHRGLRPIHKTDFGGILYSNEYIDMFVPCWFFFSEKNHKPVYILSHLSWTLGRHRSLKFTPAEDKNIHITQSQLLIMTRWHYNDVIMGSIASQITSLASVYSAV